MRIRLDLEKSLQENAAHYFESAKKAKAKLEGLAQAREGLAERAEEIRRAAELAEERATRKKPETHWYHKYRWSHSRDGTLLVGGQNASANETLVKHHAEAEDTVFHTDMAGSPFFILKGEASEGALADGALLTACYSKGWPKGLATVDVFHVKPEQVTKEAQTGEFLPKGAFMIRGDTTYHHPPLRLGIGVIEREGVLPEVFVGSEEACEKHCAAWTVIVPGDEKTSDVAKELQRRFGGDLDSYVKAIPAGGSRILEKRSKPL